MACGLFRLVLIGFVIVDWFSGGWVCVWILQFCLLATALVGVVLFQLLVICCFFVVCVWISGFECIADLGLSWRIVLRLCCLSIASGLVLGVFPVWFCCVDAFCG